MKKKYFYSSLVSLDLYKLVNTVQKSSSSFFSKELPNSELKEYTTKLCSESFLAFLNMLLPRVRTNNHLKVPTLVLGAKKDTIFSEKENKKTANKYNADCIMIDIAHDMMLDVNHKKVSNTILNWLERTKR